MKVDDAFGGWGLLSQKFIVTAFYAQASGVRDLEVDASTDIVDYGVA